MPNENIILANINELGKGVIHPNGITNFTQINQARVDCLAGFGKDLLPYIRQYIENPSSFDGLLEALFVVDKLAQNKVEGIESLYPSLSKYNNSKCPEIQTMLSGIYRKTLVPDAFGPLCRMFYNQVSNPIQGYFDPSEETGGAILEYLRSYGNIKAYPVSDAIEPNVTLKNPRLVNMPTQASIYRPYCQLYPKGNLKV